MEGIGFLKCKQVQIFYVCFLPQQTELKHELMHLKALAAGVAAGDQCTETHHRKRPRLKDAAGGVRFNLQTRTQWWKKRKSGKTPHPSRLDLVR
ncbi:hypothetical protein Q8A67_012698 [Cirrhinus molitorella]|uniref:Uncharacterized protein n=1 Tax=Cirrhinus molitorella TaxID=172907 RepID=A0AA88TK37_9TELE|nr:hypothetical protein Q8A67_012698 [Cirrhinus molitorella]